MQVRLIRFYNLLHLIESHPGIDYLFYRLITLLGVHWP